MSASAGADVVVVGGGVIGASIAYHLARRGARVVVFDPATEPRAPSASWASAGGVRRQHRDPREWPLTRRAAEMWPSLAQELGAETGFRAGGHLHVVDKPSEVDALAARVERERDAGIDVRLVRGADLRTLAPALRTVIAGSYTPGDGQAEPHASTRAFTAAASRHGARFVPRAVDGFLREGDQVAGVVASGMATRATVTVLAAGSWSMGLAAKLGVTLPIRLRSYQMLRTTPYPAVLTPTITATGSALSLKQLDGGAFLIGGGWPGTIDARTHTTAVLESSVRGSWETATAFVPAVAKTRLAESWCGLEGDSLDGVPFIGPLDDLRGLYLAAGFSGHGFQIAPAVGEAVANDLGGGAVADALAGLRCDRIPSLVAEPRR